MQGGHGAPPPYLADLICDAYLGGMLMLFPSPPEEKESAFTYFKNFLIQF